MTHTMNHLASLTAALLLAAATACTGTGKPSAAKSEHEAWVASLADSITAVQSALQQTEAETDSLRCEVGRRLRGFVHVNRPREVEGYTVEASMAGSLPLTSTGLAARITANEGFELLTALTGARYDRIIVSAPDGQASTRAVPWDQALNYRHGTHTTVAFTGPEADSVGRLIADAPAGKVRVTFLEGGVQRGSVTLDAKQQEALAGTWRLYADQHRAEALERQAVLLNRKIALFRMRLDQDKTK